MEEKKEPDNIVAFIGNPKPVKTLGELLKEKGIDFKTTPPKLDFSNVEDFLVLTPVGNFLHNTEYLNDPLFLDAINSTLQQDPDYVDLDDSELVSNSKSIVELNIPVRLLFSNNKDLLGIILTLKDIPKELM